MYTRDPKLTKLLNSLRPSADPDSYINNQFEQRLKQAKVEMKCLGSGAFGEVYELNDTQVLKVSSYRDAYYMFARYCMQNPGNPYLPVVHEMFEFKNPKGHNAYLFVLEKLVMVKHKNKRDRNEGPDIAREMPDITEGAVWYGCWQAGRYMRELERRSVEVSKTDFRKEVMYQIRKHHDEQPFTVEPSLSWLIKHDGMIQTFLDIYNLFSDCAHLDGHGNNIMLRPGDNYSRDLRGQLVITDPVANIDDDFRDRYYNGELGRTLDHHQYTTTAGSNFQFKPKGTVGNDLARNFVNSIEKVENISTNPLAKLYDACTVW